MENREDLACAEHMLARILDECMEEQLSFVPPEREIARMHTFSSKFREQMAEMLRNRRKPAGKKIEKREFAYGFNRAAACILAVLLIGAAGGLGYLRLGIPGNGKTASQSYDGGMSVEAPAEAAAGITEESAETEAQEDEAAGSSAVLPQGIPRAEFMGQMLEPAMEQNLPASLGNVKTLVNSPAISRDAREMILTIGNQEEYTIYYYPCMDLEVLIDGYWYQVPPLTEEERGQMVALEPNMAQDEMILLENYELDYEAESYRLVTYLDNMTLCSEFRFEEEEMFGEEE